MKPSLPKLAASGFCAALVVFCAVKVSPPAAAVVLAAFFTSAAMAFAVSAFNSK